MLAVVETELKAALAALVTDWPIRWFNDTWPSGTTLSSSDMPIDAGTGDPVPAIEAEVIGGGGTATVGPAGKRRAEQSGLLRLYLSVGQGTGTAALAVQADVVADGFRRRTLYTDAGTAARLLTGDPRIDDGIASYPDGDRFVRMLSIPWSIDFAN